MAKAIMIQGTMSNVGKSYVTAGLLRVFMQDGLKAAPFKSQNMALNSFVTNEGLEMGRAQVMQAEAAGIEPSADMNPILLKPTTDVGSQVIVNGKAIGNMRAVDYFKHKQSLIPQIMLAYNRLSEKYDVIVIEGAGSPAEINLKKNDIVNMGMAQMAKSPVLLVGDIDRGGVFAQLTGTYMLLEENEKKYIKGFVMNKFRGDKTILEPGIKMLEDICPVPVTGVLPYTPLDIDDEDSLSDRLGKKQTDEKNIFICVIKLPRISNFTDFNMLDSVDGCEVRYVDNGKELWDADCIIIPGTKNTIADMEWLKERKLDRMIRLMNNEGCPVVGICGGFQMLGRKITDDMGVEGEIKNINGLGLIDAETVMQSEKTCINGSKTLDGISGLFSVLNGSMAKGYEIHAGVTKVGDKEVICIGKNNVFGTYLHGLFDKKEFLNKFLNVLSAETGKKISADFSYETVKEREYDKLADMVRENMDMQAVYRILGKGM